MYVAENRYDVVVVGAGLVGAAFAVRLASMPACAKLRIAVVEGRAFVPPAGDGFDPRVVALTEASRTLLDMLDVWRSVQVKRLCPYDKMEVWDADGTGRIEFDAAEVRAPCLGHIVENSVLLSALLSRLETFGNIDLLCPAVVASVENLPVGGVRLGLQGGEFLLSELVVAADGAQSRVREMAGLQMREWDYGHRAIVTTVTTERGHEFTARQRFMSSGPLAFLPLQTDSGDSHCCSLVWSQQDEQAERLMALDDGEFCRALELASEGCLGKIQAVDKRFSFPLRQRHAVDYVKPGLALVGDAAHTIHPLAGQGVNLGFQDIVALAEEIEQALEKGLSPGNELVLGRYQRRRKPDNLGMMVVMEGFKRLFEEDTLPVRLLRNLGMSQMNAVTPLKNRIIRLLMGL